MQAARRPAQEILHPAVGVAVAGEPYPQAEVTMSGTALAAGLARDRWVYRNPFAAARAVLDNPCRLVPEHERPVELGVTDACLAPPVQVRTADPDRGDPDQARPWFGCGDRFFGDLEITDRMQPRRPHEFLPPRLRSPRFPSAAPSRSRGVSRRPSGHPLGRSASPWPPNRRHRPARQ